MSERPVAILDTNVAWFTPLTKIESLAKRFTLRVGETALLERWVQSVALYEESRPRARAKFFRCARSIAPFLDPAVPVIAGGGHLMRSVMAEADGLPAPADSKERAEVLVDQWRAIVGVELNDEEWLATGRDASKYLDDLDALLVGLARPAKQLAKIVVAEELQEANAQFDQLPDEEQRALLRHYFAETFKLSGAARERLDAHVCTAAFRLQVAAKGRRMPKRNDGADISLTAHVGQGHFLLTDEWKLVDIVDQSGTYQAPWVRRLDDLDVLPEGPPWGESALEAAGRFQRRDAR